MFRQTRIKSNVRLRSKLSDFFVNTYTNNTVCSLFTSPLLLITVRHFTAFRCGPLAPPPWRDPRETRKANVMELDCDVYSKLYSTIKLIDLFLYVLQRGEVCFFLSISPLANRSTNDDTFLRLVMGGNCNVFRMLTVITVTVTRRC